MNNKKIAKELLAVAKELLATKTTYLVWTTAGASQSDPDVVYRGDDKKEAEKTEKEHKKKYPDAETWTTTKKVAKALIASDKFFEAYIEAALWSSTDAKGEPLDKNHSKDDIAKEALRKMKLDCDKFQRENKKEIERAIELGHSIEKCGHDFWLTRNHHGSGFWDEPKLNEDDIGDKLTVAAEKFGEEEIYVNNDIGGDGKIYV